MKTVNVEKKLVDKLVEECTENVEVKLAKITSAEHEMCVNVLAQFVLYCFQYLFLSTLELVFTSFTTNT